MPSGRQSYDDENLYKKLTVKELNEYAGTERVSYEEWLASKLSITHFLVPFPLSTFRESLLVGCSRVHLGSMLVIPLCATAPAWAFVNRTAFWKPFSLLISCLPGVYRICFMGIGRRLGSIQVQERMHPLLPGTILTNRCMLWLPWSTVLLVPVLWPLGIKV